MKVNYLGKSLFNVKNVITQSEDSNVYYIGEITKVHEGNALRKRVGQLIKFYPDEIVSRKKKLSDTKVYKQLKKDYGASAIWPEVYENLTWVWNNQKVCVFRDDKNFASAFLFRVTDNPSFWMNLFCQRYNANVAI